MTHSLIPVALRLKKAINEASTFCLKLGFIVDSVMYNNANSPYCSYNNEYVIENKIINNG
jgi:hypothetical protein